MSLDTSQVFYYLFIIRITNCESYSIYMVPVARKGFSLLLHRVLECHLELAQLLGAAQQWVTTAWGTV